MLHELHRLPLCSYIRLHHHFIGKMIVFVEIYTHKRSSSILLISTIIYFVSACVEIQGGGFLNYCMQTYSHMYTHLLRHVTGIILLWRETGWEALTASKSWPAKSLMSN